MDNLVVGEKIDGFNIGVRLIDANETIKQLKHFGGWMGVGSWGMRKLTVFAGNKALRMTVSGRLHSGHVYITVNGADLYDVAFCSNRGTIKKVITDVYFDDLFRVMDAVIETPEK